ncbi:MAG: M20/M25/M40 family metallo-hydrolase [Bacteroidales bacterium]|nr:M20/M25/M40 family metallo-hydrolase [Bacteroidales bacterium]
MKTCKFISGIVFLLFFGSIASAQSTQQERLTKHVYFLASDSLKGRDAGTIYADKAARYIVQQFEEIGVEPYFKEGYYQPFEKHGTTSYKNIVGVISGNDPVLKDEYIIIGAHYDHLGVRNEKVYNGADDNASGTATIIEMARILKSHQNQLKRSVIVVAFDAEEKGLWGSYDLSEKLDLSKIKLMMSIDMVGWLHKGKTLRLHGAATIKNGKKLLEEEAKKMQMEIHAYDFETSVFGATDTQGFAKKNVPTLYVTTGLKSPYHKPEDDAELIDYQGMDRITSYLAAVTECFANRTDLQSSGKIAVIHGGKKKAFEIGPTVALANTYIAFPDAAFNGKSRYGFEAGITTQTRLSRTMSLEVKALYEWLNAKYPDENDLYSSYLPYHQESVLIPVSLLFKAGEMGVDFYVGIGGYYGYVLNANVKDNPNLVMNSNQWGIGWSIGFQMGKVKFEGGRRYQLNPLFIEEGLPKAKLSTGTININYLF